MILILLHFFSPAEPFKPSFVVPLHMCKILVDTCTDRVEIKQRHVHSERTFSAFKILLELKL